MFAIRNLSFASMAALTLCFTVVGYADTVPAVVVQSVATPEIKLVNSANFKAEVEDSKVPVIVDFYATWCGPCKLLRPNLERIAAEYNGKVKIVKVDIDASPELATRFGVNRYPTMLNFKDGKMKEKAIGLRSVEQLRTTCNDLLK